MLYLLSDDSYFPTMWLANRNLLISLVFGLVTLILHDRWRTERWKAGAALSLLCFLACVLATEGGIAVTVAPRMSIEASSYSTDQLEHLAAIIERAAPGVTVSREDLKQQLLDLLWAVGRANDGTEYSIAFQEFAALEPSHAELAERFRAIAAYSSLSSRPIALRPWRRATMTLVPDPTNMSRTVAGFVSSLPQSQAGRKPRVVTSL